jgi:IS30 family transposase
MSGRTSGQLRGAGAPAKTAALAGTHFPESEMLLREKWSPEQISGHLRRTGELKISHETIYRHIWRDRSNGGSLHTHLRQALKQRRKRYGRYDSRGRLAGKRTIHERPAFIEKRERTGHWEIDTVMGAGQQGDCVVTLVERKTGLVLIGKLPCRTKEHAIRVIVALIRRHPGRVKTITSDNGTEFHCYRAIEAATGVRFYFATPHHAWERGTSENTNGLIRQYLPKRQSMGKITQKQCDQIAQKLNDRPRKRHAYKTRSECFSPT